MIEESYDAENSRKERRKHIRVGIYAITRYFCPVRDREVGVQTRIADISEGGAQLVTFMEGVPVEAPVKMNFVMPGDKNLFVAVEGVVRHSGPLEKEKDLFRSGVEFLKIKKKDRLAIRDYVSSQRKK